MSLRTVRSILTISGMSAVGYGLYLISPILALIVGGVWFLFMAWGVREVEKEANAKREDK